MSQKEIKRLEIVQKLDSKQMKQKKAAEALGVGIRQIQRLLKDYRANGIEGLISKKLGKPSNNRLSSAVKEMGIFLIKKHYADFGPTLATEKLAQLHDIHLSIETVRKLMINDHLWAPRTHQAKKSYQPRYRRHCYGELIQIDGSDHDWFEGRGPRCSLLVYVDDATSKLMDMRFVPSESTFTYFELTKSYILKYGKPIAFYSDKFGVFRVNTKDAKGGDGITQFGRALSDLNIEIINAHTPEAKGRVERANRTLQDRFIKEMRLKGISNMEEGNAYIPEFIEDFNKRFGKEPASDTDVHRPLQSHERDHLEDIFCWQEDRTLSDNLTLQYDKRKYIIEDTFENRKLRRKRVTVYDYYDGTIKIKYEKQELQYHRVFDKLQRVNEQAIVDNKRLGVILEYAKYKQDMRDQEERSKSCPKRRHLEHALK